MCSALFDKSLLAGAAVLTIGIPGGIVRVEPQAPAAWRAERGVPLSLDEPREIVPRAGPERFDHVLVHVGTVDPDPDEIRP